MSIVARLRRYARRLPHQHAYLFLVDGESKTVHLTYAQLDRKARTIAAYLQQHRLSGQRVLLIFPHGLDFISAFLGCLYAGAVAVPLHSPALEEMETARHGMDAVIQDAGVVCLLTNAVYCDELANYAEKMILADIDLLSADLAEQYQACKIMDDSIAYLYYINTQTPFPKALVMRHKNLSYQLLGIAYAWQYRKTSISCSWLSYGDNDGLMIGWLLPLYYGSLGILMSTQVFRQAPVRWLMVISRYGVTHSYAPSLGYEACLDIDAELNLRHWQVAAVQSDTISPETLIGFTKKFAPCGFQAKAFRIVYRLPEFMGLAATQRHPKKINVLPFDGEKIHPPVGSYVSCGRLLPGLKMILIDPNTLLPVSKGKRGEIWLAGTMLPSGYWHHLTETQTRFCAIFPKAKHFYFRTGDLGFIHQGELFLVGKWENSTPTTQNVEKQVTLCHQQDTAIAVIGMSGLFPGSSHLDGFWQTLLQNQSMVSEIPTQRWQWSVDTKTERSELKWGGFVDDMLKFDAAFFNLSTQDVKLMDPQQRVLLQLIWQVIEHAGYMLKSLIAHKIGLFVGVSNNDYSERLQQDMLFDECKTGGLNQSLLANRISALLNLNGPSIAIDTACSSALVAIHCAVQAILQGDCQLALVGAVNALLSPTPYLSKSGRLSVSGGCRAFDQSADGYFRSEGAGVILLKPLSLAQADGDTIYGVIKGTAVNHSGQLEANIDAQAQVIVDAYTHANVNIERVRYIETHGVGISSEDRAEINSLKKAFAELTKQPGKPVSKTPYCGLGTIKNHVGHLEAAAGMVSVIKALLTMYHQTIPANLPVAQLNSEVNLNDSPFYLLNQSESFNKHLYENEPDCVGINGFGLAGTNAHLILQAPPPVMSSTSRDMPYCLIALSAKTQEALDQKMCDFKEWLIAQSTPISLSRLGYTLAFGREHFNYRSIFVVDSVDTLVVSVKQVVEGKCPENYLGFNQGRNQAYQLNQPIVKQLFYQLMHDLADQNILFSTEFYEKLLALGNFYVVGYDLDWSKLYPSLEKKRLVLPSYPFAKIEYPLPPLREQKRLINSLHVDDLIPEDDGDFDEQSDEPLLGHDDPIESDCVMQSDEVLSSTVSDSHLNVTCRVAAETQMDYWTSYLPTLPSDQISLPLQTGVMKFEKNANESVEPIVFEPLVSDEVEVISFDDGALINEVLALTDQELCANLEGFYENL